MLELKTEESIFQTNFTKLLLDLQAKYGTRSKIINVRRGSGSRNLTTIEIENRRGITLTKIERRYSKTKEKKKDWKSR